MGSLGQYLSCGSIFIPFILKLSLILTASPMYFYSLILLLLIRMSSINVFHMGGTLLAIDSSEGKI